MFGKSYLMYIVWLTQYRDWNFKKLLHCGSVSTPVFQARQAKASMYNIYLRNIRSRDNRREIRQEQRVRHHRSPHSQSKLEGHLS